VENADASTAPSRVRGCVTQEVTTKMPSNPASNLARARDHKRRQEQHAMDSSLLAAMASAGDESPGGDGTINDDGLRAPLETGVREPTPWFDRIEPGANDPRTWRDRAIGGGGLRARTEPGETDPRTDRRRATGDDWSRGSTETDGRRATGDDWSLGSTETSYEFLCLLKVAIWCLDIMRDALQHIRARRERVVQSPV
jgi:hypothetical protein